MLTVVNYQSDNRNFQLIEEIVIRLKVLEIRLRGKIGQNEHTSGKSTNETSSDEIDKEFVDLEVSGMEYIAPIETGRSPVHT